jgi:hypothetical protein
VIDLFGNDYRPIGGFELFWKPYPRKVGKADAEKAWKKISPNSILTEQIVAALDWQIYTWEKPYTFTPHPATWLRGRRWEDEMPEYIRVWLTRCATSNADYAPEAISILSRNGIHVAPSIVIPPSQNVVELRKQVRAEWGS